LTVEEDDSVKNRISISDISSMDQAQQDQLKSICTAHSNDAQRMLDILWQVQDQFGCISTDAMNLIAKQTNTYRVEVEGVVSFYAFFSTEPQGKFVIRLCEDIIDRHAGMLEIQRAFEHELGIRAGETTQDGAFSFHLTPCIGMCDQVPAALINDTVVTNLTVNNVKTILRKLKKTGDTQDLVQKRGDGNNRHPLINTMVNNNIRLAGDVLLKDTTSPDNNVTATFTQSPSELLSLIQGSGLRGRGGAGFPTGKKWKLAAQTPATERYIICNADEGEPGTFKDRVLLTEKADLLFEGMALAAHAVGSQKGILYLRAEYRYLQPYLQSVIDQRNETGLLSPFHGQKPFGIRIQLGAGAYICGEESSLISSCEGKRGEPKNRPPYPVTDGFLGYPTVVNNVETFCNAAQIARYGIDWFTSFGTKESSGTKLLSVSGDCSRPGIYECPMGITVQAVLDLAGAKQTAAVQVGGASGQMIGQTEFDRKLCFEDLPTAGAIMIFSETRNILDIIDYFLHFFIEESCGYCTPCRVGNVFLKKRLEKIMQGQGEPDDIPYIENLGKTIIATSRCGLGHTSPNAILSSMANFPLVYAALLKEHPDGLQSSFNIQQALDESRLIAKRRSLIYDTSYDPSQGSSDA